VNNEPTPATIEPADEVRPEVPEPDVAPPPLRILAADADLVCVDDACAPPDATR
jgi:hypothetical protein